MNPRDYKDMMSHLTRPDTRPPEVQKAAEEKRLLEIKQAKEAEDVQSTLRSIPMTIYVG